MIRSALGKLEVLVLAAAVFCVLPARGVCGEPPVVVVFGLEDPQNILDRQERKSLVERLADLVGDCAHQVIPPSKVQVRLDERYRGRRIPHKRTDMARGLGAWGSLATLIQRDGDRCKLDAYLFDLRSSSAVKTLTFHATCDPPSLQEALPDLGGRLCEFMKRVKVRPVETRRKKRTPKESRLDEAASTMAEIAGQDLAGALETRVIGDPQSKKPLRVSIITQPAGAEVKWDGKRVGKSPLRIDRVKPGWHRLDIEAPGHLPLRETLQLGSSIEMKASLLLRQRKVRVLTRPPGAEVSVDGEPRGRSPFEVTLKAGVMHRLIARIPHHRETYLEFKPKAATASAPPQEVQVELSPQPVFLNVMVSPPGACVEIGTGKEKERIVGSGTLGIVPGKTKVSAWLAGYVKIDKEVEFPVGRPSELHLVLEPLAGYSEAMDSIRSKRWQAWCGLGLAAVALSAVWPLLKWSSDSDRASDQWYQTSEQEPDPVLAQAALVNSRDMADRAEWTQISGYIALGIGAASLGWSLYSFLTYPDEPEPFGAAAVPLPDGTGGQLVICGSF